MGNIGTERPEIEVFPVTQPQPQPAPAPVPAEPAREPEPVSAP